MFSIYLQLYSARLFRVIQQIGSRNSYLNIKSFNCKRGICKLEGFQNFQNMDIFVNFYSQSFNIPARILNLLDLLKHCFKIFFIQETNEI